MTILYNCRHDGDQYRITKFDDDMNPQSSYLCTEIECECPAGVRPSCRHRSMLPKFLMRKHVGDEWFFDFDRGGWVQGAATIERFSLNDLPEGVIGIVMDSPEKVVDVDNAIAEAVGEPLDNWREIIRAAPEIETTIVAEPPAPTHIKRRF